jgi:hypothetical protein
MNIYPYESENWRGLVEKYGLSLSDSMLYNRSMGKSYSNWSYSTFSHIQISYERT